MIQAEKRISRRKAAYGFAVFLIFMWLCTVISKSIYASKLPVVAAQTPAEKYIEHIVKAQGIVVAGGKTPITALGGLRVEKILVQAGERVEKGEALFTVDMEDLREIISGKETEISRLRLQIDALAQNEKLAEEKKALEEARARQDYDDAAAYNDTLVGRAKEELSRAEKEIEDYEGEEPTQEMKDSLQSAAYAEADVRQARDNALKEAGRKVEDAALPENEDSTLALYKLELEDLQDELKKYKEIEAADGLINADAGGLVTDIYVSEGNRTTDTAAFLIADESVPYQFKATLGKEEKKYISLKDKVSLEVEGVSGEMSMSVEYVSENEASPESYEVRVSLPPGVGTPGASGILEHSESGDKYSLCVPPYAVYTDNLRNYIYVVKEREGILGMEYYIEEVNVKLLDENENWAALEGALDADSMVVVSASKEIEKGAVVRF